MNLFSSLFPLRHSWLLIISLLLGVCSILLFAGKKTRWSLICLFFSGIFIRLFVAYLDPFLHNWDERFHALVARNMMHFPFKPMLRVNDLIPYNYKMWCCNHVWLHKQPLFMWQMALSLKLFGVSEYAIRYPGVLMGSISILLIYRIGLLLSKEKQVAFIAAVLSCYSFFNLELISGLYGMDQNDVAFDFYVLCSIWAFSEYLNKKALKFVLLVGLFAGCAVLNKWLVGLLVFSAWGIIILFNVRKKDVIREVINYILSLLVCVIVFLPWQLYILHVFPMEAKYEFAYNNLHLTQIVEGHSGDWDFYLKYFNLYFGNYLCYILPFGLLLLIFLKKYHNLTSLSIIIYFVFSFLFYSTAASKGNAYFMIVAPLGYIFIGIGVYHIINFKKSYKYTFIPLTLICALLILNLPDLTNDHDPKNEDLLYHNDWISKTENTAIYKNFNKEHIPRVKYVFNVKDHLDFMFYNGQTDAYLWVPGPLDLEKLKKHHEPIAIYHELGKNDIPSYIADYDSLYIITAKFR
jgi:4-amino-4-deoxy-L-arabinose transferase-like glycosyltransferase